MSKVFDANVANYLQPASPVTVYDIGSGTISLAAWIKRSAITSANGRIMTLSGATNAQYMFYLSSTTDKIALHNGTAFALGTTPVTSTTDWVHVAATRTASSIIFYLNGVADGIATQAPATGNAVIFDIGWGGFLAGSFAGKIAYAALWNTVLTPAEVALLVTTSLATPETVGTGCVASWHMALDAEELGVASTDFSVSAKPAATNGTVAWNSDNPVALDLGSSGGIRSIAGGGGAGSGGYGGAFDDDWYRR